MATGDQSLPNEDSVIDPNLTSDEWILLQSLGSSHKSKSQRAREETTAQNQRAYVNEQRQGYELPDGIADGSPTDPQGSGPEGGFAIAPLLPIIGSIAGPLISKAISWIAGKIKGRRRGAGVRPPNRFAAGVHPPNGAGNDVREILRAYFDDNKDRLMATEQQLLTLRGRDFWKNLSAFVRSEVAQIAPLVANVTPQTARNIAQGIVNNMVPKSFQRMTAIEKHARGEGKMTSMASIVKPVVKWSIGKILKTADGRIPPEIIEQIRKETARLNDKYQTGGGAKTIKAKRFFEKVRKIAKKILNKIIPVAAKVGSTAVGPLIDKALGHFGIKGNFATDIGKEIAQSSLKKLSETENPLGEGPGAMTRFAPRVLPPSSQDEEEFVSGVPAPPSTAARRKPNGRPAKGSQEMREKMAALRAMRGRKSTTKRPAKGRGRVVTNGTNFTVTLLKARK